MVDMYEVVARVYGSDAREREKIVRDRSAGQVRGDGQLGETTLSYFWHILESGTRPLALLYHVFPERLGTEQIQTGTSGLKLHTNEGSTTTSGHGNVGDGR